MYELLASMLNGYTTSYRGIPGHCWQRIAISLIEAIVAGVIFFLSLYFVRDLHFSVAVAGLLIACYGVGTAIGGVAGGKLSDRYRPTIVSILGLGIMGVAFLILGHLTNAILLGVCLFLIGFSAYCFVTSNTLWILNYCVDENTRHKSISVTYAILNLGLGAGALLVILLGRNRFDAVFVIAGLLLILCSVYLVILTLTKTQHVVINHTDINDSHSHQQRAKSKKLTSLILLCVFIVGIIIAQRSSTYSIYIDSKFYNMGISSVGLLFIINTVMIVLFQVPLNHYLARYNIMKLVGFGILLMGLGTFVLSFSISYVIPVLACVVYTLGEMLFMPKAQLLCYQLGIANKRGYSLGLYRTVYATSMIVGPALGGVVYNSLGGDAIWVLCGVLGLIGLFACFAFKRHYQVTSK